MNQTMLMNLFKYFVAVYKSILGDWHAEGKMWKIFCQSVKNC